jgi:hypothetical protein
MAAKTQISTEECYRKAFDGGYAGALAWQYIGDKTESNFGGYTYTIDPALDAMKALAATEEASIKIKDVAISQEGGDGKMAVTYGGDNAQIEYQKTWDLSSANTFTFEATNMGESDAQLNLIFKLTSAWTWTEVPGPCEVGAGETKTCSFDISGLAAADRKQTLSVVIANYAAGYTGTILYDNFKADDQVLWDFNEDKYDAFSRGFENTEEMIPEIKIVFGDPSGICMRPQVAGAKALRVSGNMLSLSMGRTQGVTAELFDVTGHKVVTLHKGTLSAGTHQFKVNAAAGTYFVKVAGQGINLTQKVMLK